MGPWLRWNGMEEREFLNNVATVVGPLAVVSSGSPMVRAALPNGHILGFRYDAVIHFDQDGPLGRGFGCAPLGMLLDNEELATMTRRSFAEAFVADPKRNQTKAAIAAGAVPSRAPMTASRWVRLGKVGRFIHALEAAAKARALTPDAPVALTTLERTEAAVASL